MGTITFDVKAQLDKLKNGEIEVLLESSDGYFESPTDWEQSIKEKYRGKDIEEKKKKVSDLLAQYAKRKKQEPLFKKKLAILEQQKFIDENRSIAWRDIAQSGMRYARDDLRRTYGMDYINKKFVKI